MAYGIPPLGGGMATPARPVQLAPTLGTPPRQTARRPPSRRVQQQPGRPPQPTQRRQRPQRPPGRGAAPPGLAQPIADPMQFPPLAEEVADLGAAVGMARFPGVGQPGSERGVLDVRRRRRV
jgi:hypothetical protein